MIPDAQIAAEILAQAHARAPKTLCPSEVAKSLLEDWRSLMPEVRLVAAEMPEIKATQRGVPVKPLAAKGPIRLSLANSQ